MTRDVFARATQSILGRLGKDALLRGAPAGKAHIEHGVEVYERTGDHEGAFARSVATIESVYGPASGDVLVILGSSDGSYTGDPIATYKVQSLVSDSGYAVRRVVLPVAIS